MPNLFVIDVGHGNSAVLVDRERTIVIDAGRGSQLLEFLVDQEIHQIDALLLSHSDADHIAGALNVAAADGIRINSVYLNSNSNQNSDTWRDLLITLSHIQPKPHLEAALTEHVNGRFDFDSVKLEVLAPSFYIASTGPGGLDPKGRKITSNASSVVIRLQIASRNVALFAGDIDSVGLENLLDTSQDMAADILIFPHHGGSPSSNYNDHENFFQRLCDSAKPRVIIFSIGKNKNRFPKPTIIDALAKHPLPVIVLATQHSDALSQMSNAHQVHRCHTDVGTIRINLDAFPICIEWERPEGESCTRFIHI